MSALDHLTASVAALGTAVDAELAQLKAVSDALKALQGQTTIDPAAVDAAATAIDASIAKLQAAVAPPPAPQPSA